MSLLLGAKIHDLPDEAHMVLNFLAAANTLLSFRVLETAVGLDERMLENAITRLQEIGLVTEEPSTLDTVYAPVRGVSPGPAGLSMRP